VSADWNLDPRRWPNQMGARIDAGWELVDGTCDDCGRREGVRPVHEDPKAGGGVLMLCTRCLVFDHQHRSWKWELVHRRERARLGAAEQELVPT
jgi:hypothetical protein